MLWKRLVLALVSAPLAIAQSGALPLRETLNYSVEWRLITAGKARMEWAPSEAPGYSVNLHLESVGLVSKLFKVDSRYTASLNRSLCAVSTQLISSEGSRQRDTRVSFDYDDRRARYLERDRAKNAVVASEQTEIPGCVHDVIGGLYYLRTLNLEPNQSIQAPLSDGKKAVSARIEAQRREDISVPAGNFKTIRYEIFVFDNVLYRRSAHLHVWLTDDRRKLPVQVRVRMAFTVGTITFQLEKQE